MCRPPRSGERGGRTSFRTADRGAVDAGGGVHERREQGGVQPREVPAACGRAALKRTAKARGPGCRCYSQALRRCAAPNRARCTANSRGDGGKQDIRLRGERAIRRQTSRREGRMIGCPVSPSCIACAMCSHGGLAGASRHPAFPAPFFRRGREADSKTRAEAPRAGEGMSACHIRRYRRVGKAKRAHASRVATDIRWARRCAPLPTLRRCDIDNCRRPA